MLSLRRIVLALCNLLPPILLFPTSRRSFVLFHGTYTICSFIWMTSAYECFDDDTVTSTTSSHHTFTSYVACLPCTSQYLQCKLLLNFVSCHLLVTQRLLLQFCKTTSDLWCLGQKRGLLQAAKCGNCSFFLSSALWASSTLYRSGTCNATTCVGRLSFARMNIRRLAPGVLANMHNLTEM
jgi:hypothetical protein